MSESDPVFREPLLTFHPGWPDIAPHGLIVSGSSVSQLDPDPSDDSDHEDEVRWTIQVGMRSEAPRLAFIGELEVRNFRAYGQASIVMPFELREEPEDLNDDYLNELLEQYGSWSSSIIYDHAALVIRSASAGYGLPLLVPFGTPHVDLLPR